MEMGGRRLEMGGCVMRTAVGCRLSDTARASSLSPHESAQSNVRISAIEKAFPNRRRGYL